MHQAITEEAHGDLSLHLRQDVEEREEVGVVTEELPFAARRPKCT
jgi:hypothetical protein